VRQALRRLRERIQHRLQDILLRNRDVVQDTLITIRNDRFVIPLKADFRRALRGIVHGESASGATVYVEPEPVVDLNNQLFHAQAEEERAIRDVLRELTARVAVQRVGLAQAQQIMGEVDLVVAKGRLSTRMQGVSPQFTDAPQVHLLAARHPMIAEPVPVDVQIGPEDRTLVITGPNTGGKTAVLKTVGLLVLMAQSGLHIPAGADSRLPVFREVFVDLGDEQSLQQNLSTFSAHLANISVMLKEMSPHVLVLLDELGAGTDPMEGGPLGVALLESFHNSGAITVVTTHHSTIKTFAVATPQIACAAVDFELDTLQPRYRLVPGLPGRSQAFAIAEKLGIPPDIIARAQHETSATQMRGEQLLAELELYRQELETQRQQMQAERADIDRLHSEAQTLRDQAQAEDHRIRQELHAEGQTLLKTVRQDLDATIAELRRQAPDTSSDTSPIAFPQANWQQAVQTVTSLAADLPVPPVAAPSPLQVGDQVRVRGLNIVGRVMAEMTAQGQVQVEVGNKMLTVAAGDLERTGGQHAETAPAVSKRSRSSWRRPASAESVAPELRLLGSTVDDALPAVEQYLDRATVQGIPRVRIIHGIGSGRLREAIADFLQHHPLVHRFHVGDAGGGTTIVELEG
jgi:DNA mismatch repair protein MutS2